jgi:large subunit ribosomal protein L9
MADMFEREVAGFTEEFDPSAEPGSVPDEPEAAPAEAETAEEAEPEA